MNQKQRLARRAQAYDQCDRASDHGPGRPPGPPGKVRRAPRATGSAAVLRRLRKNFPELHKLVLAGELTVCKAATVAGLRRGSREACQRAAADIRISAVPDEPNITRTQEMELWLGASHHGSAFASEEERRRLWTEHRDRLMRLFGQDGCRPMAWWKYESPVPFPGLKLQRSTLYEHGLLGEAEARALVIDWRAEFKRASQPDFVYVAGPGEIYQGALARQKHFAWADIPPSLLQQWEAKTVCASTGH
jgi:hypothetical protein